MTIFDGLSLIGGLALFLFGMNLMGGALEKKAGGQLKSVLGKMTENTFKGFMLGMIVTSIIQSSSATTVMVVGFVNSGIMTLHQAIGPIMGANVGTTITSWILSLTAIKGGGFMNLLKPDAFVPVLAIYGIYLLMFNKKSKSKDTAMILLGFATLMTGMSTMSDAVSGLKEVPEFTNILTLFSNPVLGVLAGAVLTAIIQSSSASVGILQAISTTGAITFGTAIPVVMGMAIGTCITAVISAIGANKNAKRTTLVHLYFNIFGTIAALALFYGANAIFKFDFVNGTATEVGIAIVNTTYKVFCVLMWAPMTKLLEKLSVLTIRDTDEKETYEVLDERLLSTPTVAVERCKDVTMNMADIAISALLRSLDTIGNLTEESAEYIIESEKKTDKFEDKLGSYLVKLSSHSLTLKDSLETSKLLHVISDFERISDHAASILKSSEEIQEKKIVFSENAQAELDTITAAIKEITEISQKVFRENNFDGALRVEALEQIVDDLKEKLLRRHTKRLQKGECTIEQGFVFKDIITNLERVADHCSNIAGCVIEIAHDEMDLHSYVRQLKKDDESEYWRLYEDYQKKYTV